MAHTHNILRKYLVPVFFCILAVAADQFTKYLAVTQLKGKQAFELIPGVLEFSYVENRGAAFGLFQNQQMLFVTIAVIFSGLAVWFLTKIPDTKRFIPLKICVILLISGAVGNVIDRMSHKFVIDFISFSLIDFPVFNVADCYVVIACILFAGLVLFFYQDKELEIFSWK